MGDAVVSRFTTAQLARILDLPPSEIRRWVRTGLLRRARGKGGRRPSTSETSPPPAQWPR